MVNVSTVDAVDCSTLGQTPAVSVEVDAVIDPDELMAELKEEQERVEALIQRSIEQKKDIREMDEELTRLKEDIAEAEADAIQSEQVET